MALAWHGLAPLVGTAREREARVDHPVVSVLEHEVFEVDAVRTHMTLAVHGCLDALARTSNKATSPALSPRPRTRRPWLGGTGVRAHNRAREGVRQPSLSRIGLIMGLVTEGGASGAIALRQLPAGRNLLKRQHSLFFDLLYQSLAVPPLSLVISPIDLNPCAS